ncbi:MAG: hypothetical protein FWD33_02515 [Alphaproteobacteria bacterium]|nr:hypothetical protein [Alphaproteobacteria bacterium]
MTKNAGNFNRHEKSLIAGKKPTVAATYKAYSGRFFLGAERFFIGYGFPSIF